MDGHIELIFEGVPHNAVDMLLNGILQGSEILELSHSELGKLDLEARHRLIQHLNQSPDPSSIVLRAIRASIGAVCIGSPLLRILRFDGANELTIVFTSADVAIRDRQHLITQLADGAQGLASSADVTYYYCGFEPAADERTQLFSGERIGPSASI